MSESPEPNLQSDPLLRDAPTIHGFKVLDPAVLYAKVGQGGMGAVYRGRHFKLDIDVAVKCLRPSLAAESPEFVARFEREARLAAQLTHQNVVNVMDVHQKHGLHYLVMEFVTGENARERVMRKGKLAEQEALAILLGAVTGLAEAHALGIVHRDIKPDNVLVSLQGRVKLADLGLAKASQSSGVSMSLASGVMGTPQYMAPEQWDSPDVAAAADIWALGATLYYLLVGEHGIQGKTLAAMARQVQDQPFPSLRDARPGLAEPIYMLCERCVAKDPSERFVDASAMLKILRPLVQLDEGALADAESGANRAQESLVSPPPRQTLMTIRAQVESGLLTRAERAELDHEAATLMSPRSRDSAVAATVLPETLADAGLAQEPAVRRGKASRVVLSLGLLAGVAAVTAWFAGYFDDATNWEEVMRHQRAKSLYWQAKDLLPKPDGLDEAIAKLEECLQLMPSHELASAPLAVALDKRAEQLTATDLDGAYVAIRRAKELDGSNQAVADRHVQLEQSLRSRLFAGLEITSPSGFDLLRSQFLVAPTQEFELKGRVTSRGFKQLEMQWPISLKLAGGEVVRQVVPVVAGEFAVAIKLPAKGDHTLTVTMSDGYGISGQMKPTVRVCGQTGLRLMSVNKPLSSYYNAAGCRMRAVKSGTFNMGSWRLEDDRDEDESQREVTLTSYFWLADTEVTQAQWLRIMQTEPWPKSSSRSSLDVPATNMTRQQALQFCRALNDLEVQARRLPQGFQYGLPTEAQWEWACRAEAKTAYSCGPDAKELRQHAVFGQSGPSKVGALAANAFGFFDMHGNVAEWCADSATAGANGNIVTLFAGNTDPIAITGELVVYRGGSYNSPAKDCRSAARAALPAAQAAPTIGFRPALIRR